MTPPLDPLPDDVRRAFDAERATAPLSDADAQALAERIGRSLASLPVPPIAPRVPVSWLSVATAFVAGAVTHAVVQPWFAEPVAPAVPSVTRPAVEPSAPPPQTPAVVVEPPAPVKPAPVVLPPRPRPSEPPPPVPDARVDAPLEREQVLLNMARSALARQRPEDARAALEQHRVEAPRGALREERDFLWLQVLVAQGQHDEARAHMRAFEREWPESLYLPALPALEQRIDAGP